MNPFKLAYLPALLAIVANLAFVGAESDLSYAEGFSKTTHTLVDSQEVTIPENANSTHSRRLLAELLRSTVKVEPSQMYRTYFKGYSCVKYSVTSTGEDVHVMLMRKSSYLAFEGNSFSGSYTYVQGSMCEQTYECKKTINGILTSETYYLVAMNDYDGLFGGNDAVISLLLETCSNSPTSDALNYFASYISLLAASVILMLQ